MAVSKKIRFEVFNRDGFRCAYCGKTPPEIILEVDHIDPVAKKGKDDINNLLTSCFDCNRGKSNVPLSRIPSQLVDNLSVLQEKEAQIKAYRQFVKKIENRLNKDIEDINNVYKEAYPGWELSDNFKKVSLKTCSFSSEFYGPEIYQYPFFLCNNMGHIPSFIHGTSYNPPVKRNLKSSQNQDLQNKRF